MKVQQAMLVALVAAVAVTTVAAADSDATKQRVAITTQADRTTTVSKALLVPLQAGALRRDSGSLVGESPSSHKFVMRDGQRVEIYGSVGTFKGKRGSIVMRIGQEYVEAGNGYHPATGTWRVVRGTGDYAVPAGDVDAERVTQERGAVGDLVGQPVRDTLSLSGKPPRQRPL